MRNKPVVGQQLILHYSRRKYNYYHDVVVSKVGRKYFEVEPCPTRNVKFHVENWHEVSEYSASYFLYSDRGEIRSKITHQLASQALRKYFSSYCGVPATTAQLMSACEALDLQEGVKSELDEKLNKLYEELGEI